MRHGERYEEKYRERYVNIYVEREQEDWPVEICSSSDDCCLQGIDTSLEWGNLKENDTGGENVMIMIMVDKQAEK